MNRHDLATPQGQQVDSATLASSNYHANRLKYNQTNMRAHTNSSYDYDLKGPRAKSYKMNTQTFEPKVIDYIFRNHQIVKEVKSTDFEKAKRDIECIYEQLGVHRITNGDVKRL